MPCNLDDLNAMAKSLRISQQKAHSHDGGYDPQSAASVAKSRCERDPPELEASLRYAMIGEARSPWRLPSAVCAKCGVVFGRFGPGMRRVNNGLSALFWSRLVPADPELRLVSDFPEAIPS